jgi:hypothetical protein
MAALGDANVTSAAARAEEERLRLEGDAVRAGTKSRSYLALAVKFLLAAGGCACFHHAWG